MRINISDIMKATKCSEADAVLIEAHINANQSIDWSEDSQRRINKVAREVHSGLLGERQ